MLKFLSSLSNPFWHCPILIAVAAAGVYTTIREESDNHSHNHGPTHKHNIPEWYGNMKGAHAATITIFFFANNSMQVVSFLLMRKS